MNSPSNRHITRLILRASSNMLRVSLLKTLPELQKRHGTNINIYIFWGGKNVAKSVTINPINIPVLFNSLRF